jgi:hypothetical protein
MEQWATMSILSVSTEAHYPNQNLAKKDNQFIIDVYDKRRVD